MIEPITLDPLTNRRVIFKLHGHEPMETTNLSYDDTGYWIKGGTLGRFVGKNNSSDGDVQFLEFNKIQWFKAAT
jgi:hypothetical protein